MSGVFKEFGKDYTTINLGLVPTRRDTFPLPKDALAHKEEVMPVLLGILNGIHDVNVLGIDDIVEDGLLVWEKDVVKVENYLRANNVDALFFPHMNFGQEESVAKLAKALDVPVLLWGPRDGIQNSDDKLRLYDAQCGMFATSRAFLRYGVPFTYIENCWLDDPQLAREIEKFIRVCSVVKSFRRLRVLQLSTRPRQFLSVKVNEGELMERFGIEVTPIESSEILSTVDRILAKEQDRVQAVIDHWNQEVNIVIPEAARKNATAVALGLDIPEVPDERTRNAAAVLLGIQDLAEKYNCRTVATECWSMYLAKYGVSPCLSYAELTQNGLPVCCECDINGAISSVLVQAATRHETPSFFADITVRHPHNDNAELMWHCGPYPPCLARDAKPTSNNLQCSFELKPGEITMTRFDGNRGVYNLFSDLGRGVDGPATTGSYVWFETNDWPAWERKLMYGPYIHHIVGAYGNYKEVMREATRYMNGVVFDSVE